MLDRRLLLTLIATIACSAEKIVAPEEVAAVSITAQKPETVVGRTLQLAANPVDAAGGTIPGLTAVWTSGSEAIATVTQSGVVTGVSPGVATIQAVVGQATGVISITVLPVPLASVVISAPSPSLPASVRTQLSATGRDSTGATITGRPVKWSWSDTTRVWVDVDGIATGLKTGSVTIFAEIDGRAGSLTLDVVAGPPASIAFAAPSVAVYTGGEASLEYSVRDPLGNQVAAPQVEWTSSDPSTVAVTSGVIRGVKSGEGIKVSARAGDATASVDVKSIRVTSIGGGDWTTCFLSEAGEVYCWGLASNGEVGAKPLPGDTVLRPVRVSTTRRFVLLTTGDSHSCALTADGTAYCWGSNASGQIGTGTLGEPVTVPTEVRTSVKFVLLAAGREHTCGLTDGGEAYCWSLTSPLPASVPTDLRFVTIASGEQTCGLTADGSAWCWSPHVTLPQWPGLSEVAGSLRFSSLFLRRSSHCGITTDGRSVCWGRLSWSNAFASVPVEITSIRMKSLSPVTNRICGISVANKPYCMGYGPRGEIGDGVIHQSRTGEFVAVAPGPGNLDAAIAVATGLAATSAISESGAPYAWGVWAFLGAGVTTDQLVPVRVLPPLN